MKYPKSGEMGKWGVELENRKCRRSGSGKVKNKSYYIPLDFALSLLRYTHTLHKSA